MPPPDKGKVTVATDTLRTEATQWDHVATLLGGMETKVRAMELGRVEAGLFQMIVSPYNEVIAAVGDRCREGRQRTGEVATTLRHVADTYDQEDADNTHTLRNLY